MDVIKGNLVFSKSLNELVIRENACIAFDDKGIEGIYDSLPSHLKDANLTDYGNALILPSFCDMHLHAPQYPMLGIGMDLPLIDWLNTYTFPTEAHFADKEVARRVYSVLAKELIQKGTTRVAMFSSLHTDATIILMEELEKAGVVGYVGKVNMDRNGGVNLQETTEESINETIRFIKESKKFKHLKPIITPRFTPSCTNELMEALGRIARDYNLPIQSHLSENVGEIAWVKELHPDTTNYYESYEKYGLWNNRTLMAHCVHSNEKELSAIKDAGVAVVHCPSSNENLTSGYARVRKMLDMGIAVYLGSDIAGGDHLSMFDNVAAAIRASKARMKMDEDNTPFLNVEEAFYLATTAPASFFGDKTFEKGAPLHAIVLTDDNLPTVRKLSVKERFERAIYRQEENAIKAVYSENKRVL